MFHFKLTILLAITLQFKIVKNDKHLVHQVLIVANDGGVRDHCGGALLKYDWAVTSLVCIEKLFKNFLFIQVLGEFHEKIYKQTRYAQKYVHHINRIKKYDFAMVQTDKPFTASDALKPARLPAKGEEPCELATTVAVFLFDLKSLQRESSTVLTDLGTYEFKNLNRNYSKKIRKSKSLNTFIKGMTEQVSRPINDSLIKNRDQFVIKKTDCKIFSDVEIVRTKSIWSSGLLKLRRGGAGTAAIFIANLLTRYRHTCGGSRGWPLYCGDKLVGIEANCEDTGFRSDDGHIATYVGVAENADIIAKAIGITFFLDKSKMKGSISWSFSGAGRTYNVWRQLLLVLGFVLIVTFGELCN